jgi:hypothetical protein
MEGIDLLLMSTAQTDHVQVAESSQIAVGIVE